MDSTQVHIKVIQIKMQLTYFIINTGKGISMLIAVAQINLEPGNKSKTIETISQYVEKASKKNVELIVFPEMCDTGYDMSIVSEESSSRDDNTYQRISMLSKKHNINIAIGLSDKRGSDIFNTLSVFGKDGNIISQYDKIHLFTGDPVREQDILSFGKNVVTFTLNNFTIGLQVCYDIRFPELSRKIILNGANLLVISAAWPKVRKEHWTSILKTRAIENQCYIAASNRTGTDAGISFAGNSMIISPLGEILESLSDDDENFIFANIDIQEVMETRKNLSVFNDRREDIYNS